MTSGEKSPAPDEAPGLDDLMLAMDVVDTIRHQNTLIERELGQEERDKALKIRLREIYSSQGLEVSERVLNQGLTALKESRFVYQRRGAAFARFLALAWVRRRAVAVIASALLIVLLGYGAWSAWQRTTAERAIAAAQIELNETLPTALAKTGQAALDAAKTEAAQSAAERLIADGEEALSRADPDAVRAALSQLSSLRADLLRQYKLRIVSRPGENTGVFRVPDVNQAARNYYLIVEAVSPTGDLLALPITSEEDGTTESVTKFGVRVPRSTYDAVAADKRADGIVDDDILGKKDQGSLAEAYLMGVEDGRIRQW